MINKLLRIFSGVILFCLIYVQIGCEEPYDQLKEIQNGIKDLIYKMLPPHDSVKQLSVSIEVVVNTIDGSAREECQVQDEVEADKKHEAWIAFGAVKPQKEQGWEAVASITRCGDGSFDKVSTLVGRALAIPYVIIGIETVSSVRGDRADLETTLKIQKLSSFDDKGRPVYARSEQKRNFSIGPGDYAIVPLLVADPRERDGFNIHELYVRLTAPILGREVAAYGAVSVTVDLPGLDILIDGGVVGRSLEKRPTVLKNIRVGKREVRVKDYSERGASKQVVVEKDRTVEVNLKILNLPSPPGTPALVTIGKNPQGYDEYWRARDGAVVVKVPAGPFLMGSAEGEGESNERPQRLMFVSEFLMDKTPVTWRQFRRYAEATGAPLPPAPPWGRLEDHPATSVLNGEAKAYCEWVGGRLPTEAEWEKAARGTDGRKYLWGNQWDPDQCNSQDGGPHRPKGVGSFPGCVSPYGIVDMAGSGWEWTADWYAAQYPEVSELDPKEGLPSGTRRVMRGGSWLSNRFYLRTAYRHNIEPNWRNVHNGVRCVQAALR